MTWWNQLRRRGQMEEQLEKELAFHLEQCTADLIARGVPPDEARRQARMELGGPEQVKEQCRDARGTRWLEDLWKDLHYALRMFAKNPGTTAVAVLSLVLAIGPNAALFTVVDRMFLKPITVQGSSEIFFLYPRLSPQAGRAGKLASPSYPDFLDYQTRGRGVADVIASNSAGLTLHVNGANDLVFLNMVSDNYFPVLGVRAAIGRMLVEGDARAEGAPPVVLSYALWQRKFGGAADIAGKTVMLQFQPCYVVGVAPRDFLEPNQHLIPSDAWAPMSAASHLSRAGREGLIQRGKGTVDITVRLRPGVNRQQAETTLSAITAQLSREYPATNRATTVYMRPAADPQTAVLGAIILSLVSLVLLIACANIAGIRLAQGEARRREFAIRLALGAGRGRLLRQLLAESLLLALAAAGLGLLLAHGLIQAIPAALPALPFQLNLDLHVDARMLAYVLALAMVTTLATGLLPALRVSRPDLIAVLKGETPGAKSRSWFRDGLVIAQIACAQFLLVATGLVVGSYLQVQHIRPGFDTNRQLLIATLIPATDHPKANLYEDMLGRLKAIPGVRRVTSASSLPLSGSGGGSQLVSIPGVTAEPVGIGAYRVGPEYFTMMGTAILRGREFAALDSAGVVIVNEHMARGFWGDADRAIGRFIRVDGQNRQIIGVVETGKYQTLLDPPAPIFFLPAHGAETLLIETAGDPAAMADSVRKAFRESVTGVALNSLITMRQQMGVAFFLWRAAAGLLGVIAILGIFLAGVGLYGVVSYGVTCRSREIGIRMAMGARPADVLRVVLRQGLSMVLIGAAAGTAVAIAAARVISALLYRVSPADPLALTGAVLAVAAVTFFAIQMPARRAIHTDPMTVLRSE
jgi:macrolide transport system ATP-binding/permease protein